MHRCGEDVNDSPESTRTVECGEPAVEFWLERDGSPGPARCAAHRVRALAGIMSWSERTDLATYEAAIVMSA